MAASSYGQTFGPCHTPSLTSPPCKIENPFVVSHQKTIPVTAFRPHSQSAGQLTVGLSRRNLLELGLGFPLLAESLQPSLVAAEVSLGYRRHIDNLDGYSFSYPEGWIQVRGSGADVFFRDPVHLDENVSLEISSPSSSRFKDVEDLGTPDQAAQKVLKQYLTEFMSTRLGVRRESKIVYTNSRVADDGKLYYDIEVNVKSYANNQQMAVMPQDRIVQLEWDRRYLSVLGVENSRLYELRLQAPEYVLAKEEGDLRKIMDSFRVFKI